MDWSQSHARFFRAMLLCYPAAFREEYGAEMERLFQERLHSEPRFRLWLETVTDILITSPKEHLLMLFADVAYGCRVLMAIPGFTAIALLVITLGIGATVSIFSVVNAVLLRSLPYGHPEKLIYIWRPNQNFKGLPQEMGPNIPDCYEWQRLNHSLSSMTIFGQTAVNAVRNGYSTRVGAAFVTGTFFQTLEAMPAIGRPLDAQDDQAGHDQVAVISDEFRRFEFGSATNVIGKQIQLNRRKYTVVGVMPKEFGFPFDGDVPYDRTGFRQTDIWLPAAYSVKQKTDRADFQGALAVGRLREGVSVAAAQADLAGIEARVQPLYSEMWRGWTVFVKPLVETIIGPVEKMLWLLLGAVGLVFVIAVSNVASLLLARATARAHELGIRTALGAARSRIIRQLLTESLLLSCIGGALGVAFAYAAVHFLTALNPGNIPRFDATNVDGRALAVAVLLSVGTGLVAGLAPALSASRNAVNHLLKRGGNRVAGGYGNGRFALIILEMALSVILLAGSGLLIRSYLQLAAVDPGFSPATLTFSVGLDERYEKPELQERLYKNFLEKLSGIQSVRYAGATTSIPLTDTNSVTFAEIRGFGRSRDMIESWSATPDYRKAIGIPLLLGRDFDVHDVSAKPPVVIVNKSFADAYFHGGNLLGGQVRIGIGDFSGSTWATVIGVVGNTRHNNLEEASKPQLFQPALSGDNFAVLCVLPIPTAISQARQALRSLDPLLTLDGVHTMGERMQQSNARRRFQTWLLTGFAVIAIALALVGIYGLMAYTVKQRTSEIGVRLAVGSSRTRILGLVLSQGLQLACYGLIIGLVGAFALTRLVQGWLFGVNPHDPLTFVAVPAFILAVACCACIFPALSATRIDPMRTLRQE